MREIPLLKPVDVELRVAQLKETSYGVYVTLLAYKDARVDQKLLDQIFGATNWKKEHQLIGDKMFCTVSIWDEAKGQWIPKQDVGVESNTEAVKGMVSDSFKRACFCWGIGRELYDAPDIHFKLNDNEISSSSYGKSKTYAKFHVGNMVYDRETGSFVEFTVLDEAGNIRFSVSKSDTSKQQMQHNEDVKHTEPVSKPAPVTQGPKPFSSMASSTCNVCSECSAEIKSSAVIEISKKKYGKVLCYNCQKKHG